MGYPRVLPQGLSYQNDTILELPTMFYIWNTFDHYNSQLCKTVIHIG